MRTISVKFSSIFLKKVPVLEISEKYHAKSTFLGCFSHIFLVWRASLEIYWKTVWLFRKDSTVDIITSFVPCYIIEEAILDRRQDHEGMEL